MGVKLAKEALNEGGDVGGGRRSEELGDDGLGDLEILMPLVLDRSKESCYELENSKPFPEVVEVEVIEEVGGEGGGRRRGGLLNDRRGQA